MTDSHYTKPLPAPDPLTEPFWEACRAHQLSMPRCQQCGMFVFFPAPMCHGCNGTEFAWERLSGRGSVYTFVVVHQATLPGFAADAPYVVAWIELIEQAGLKMVSNVVGCGPDEVHVGMPVEVTFDDVDTTYTLPKFRPA